MALCKPSILCRLRGASVLSKSALGINSQCMFSSRPTKTRDSSLTFQSPPIVKKELTVASTIPSAPEDLPQWDLANPFKREKQSCVLCRYDIKPDYKNVKLLSQFVSRFTGKVYGRHITRLCKHKQEAVEFEISKAQTAGFMPYYFRDLQFTDDPKLFNPERPVRRHPY